MLHETAVLFYFFNAIFKYIFTYYIINGKNKGFFYFIFTFIIFFLHNILLLFFFICVPPTRHFSVALFYIFQINVSVFPPKEAIMLNCTYCKLSAQQKISPFSLLSKWKWSMLNCFFSLSVLNNKLRVEWKKNSFQRLLRRIFGFYFLTYSIKLFFWADLKVPVCHVMYASTLWSTCDNNSWELFTLFWNTSKRCQVFCALGCLCVQLALGYWMTGPLF